VRIPAGGSVSYAAGYLPGLEHHLWMLEGTLTLETNSLTFRLAKGDCLRYVLSGPSRFACGKQSAHYVIAMVHS